MRRHLDISRHEQHFADYAALERAKAHGDTAPLDLKIRHTCHVLANARDIVGNGRFSPLVAR
ncbi:MAG: phosphohydrolase, partial [Desulfovibrio sp.]|nr:phosphohydrolase [Desulfovibrio sp.]